MITVKRIQDYQLKRMIKKAFVRIFKQKGLFDENGELPKIKKIEFTEYGITLNIDISGICSYSDLEKQIEYIKTSFKAYEVNFRVIEGLCRIGVCIDKLEPKKFSKIVFEPYICMLGYNYDGNITVDMRTTPHLLICGLSGQGKTECAKTIIRNLEGLADIVVINAFRDDFKGYRVRFINDLGKILSYLQELLQAKKKRKRPLYLVIDELLVLTKNKEINKAITDFLAIARHYNIFIIGISQEGTKESIKFKHLFNARCTFRQIEESSYRVILGCSINGDLNKQEFYLYSDGLYKGRTFDN